MLLQIPGKSPTDPNSYHPISLLQSDIKSLVKVLAKKLDKVVANTDKTVSMPHKSMPINLRCVFLNMQTPSDNIRSRQLLSLDAKKAFDSLEWFYLWAMLKKFGFGEVSVSRV